jgi:hypothetical protein
MADGHEFELIQYDTVFVEVDLPGLAGFTIPICRPRSGQTLIQLLSAMRTVLTQDFGMELDNCLVDQGKSDESLPPGYRIVNGALVVDPAGWSSSDEQWYDANQLSDWFSSRQEQKLILSEVCTLVLQFIDTAAEVSKK